MAIKVQTLANFIVEFTHDITLNLEVEIPKDQNQDDDITRWKHFVDGSSNQHGYGANGICYMYRIQSHNNEAEYEALLARLRVAIELRVESLDAYNDS